MLKRLPLTTDRAMLAAPFLFVLLWSSSFVTTKVGLRHISPLLFVAIRLVVCAIVLTVVMLLLRRSWRPLSGWKWVHCAIAGALMNAVGLMVPHVGLLTALAALTGFVSYNVRARGPPPRQETRRLPANRPCQAFVSEESDSKRTSTRQQLDCTRTL